jgi:hypothetical protein
MLIRGSHAYCHCGCLSSPASSIRGCADRGQAAACAGLQILDLPHASANLWQHGPGQGNLEDGHSVQGRYLDSGCLTEDGVMTI